MKKISVFLKTFIITLSLMSFCYFILYLSINNKTSVTGENKSDVPINMPGVNDSKTLFLEVGEENPFFFLIKFNAIEGKVCIASISPSYKYQTSNRTLSESLKKAGIMQCVLETSKEFDIKIDYFLECSWQELGLLIGDLSDFGIENLGENIPKSIKNFLLKGAENLDGQSLVNAAEKAGGFLDNELGLGFLNESAYLIIKNNINVLADVSGKRMKNNYNKFNTDINPEGMKNLERILNFLTLEGVEYPRCVITKNTIDANDKISETLK